MNRREADVKDQGARPSFEVPEIIEVLIKNGLGAYFRFIDERCG